MIKLQVNNKEHILPLYPDEVSVRQGVAIQPYLKDNPTIKDKINIISILANANYTDFSKVNKELLDRIYNKLPYIAGEGTFYIGKTFKIGKDIYSVKPIEDMNLLEWIDLNVALLNPNENAHYLLSVLLQKVKTKPHLKYFRSQNLYSCGFKPYRMSNYSFTEYDGQLNTQLVDKFGYFTFSRILIEALNEINRIVNEYPKIYGTDDAADKLNKELHPELYATDDSKEDDESPKYENNPLSIWGLYHLLSSICNDVKTEIDYWLKKPFREFLEHATYVTTKQELNNR